MAGHQIEGIVVGVLNEDAHKVSKRPLHYLATSFMHHSHLRPHLLEGKPAAQSYIDYCEASIRGIHRPDDVKISRQSELILERITEVVRQSNLARGSVICLQQKNCFAKDLRHVCAIDFVDV